MLVTLLYWWLFDGDWFEMLVSESLCWRLFSLCWWFSQCIKSVTNILNRSPISQTCHQHLVSNIRHQHRCKHSSLIKFVKSHREFHMPKKQIWNLSWILQSSHQGEIIFDSFGFVNCISSRINTNYPWIFARELYARFEIFMQSNIINIASSTFSTIITSYNMIIQVKI